MKMKKLTLFILFFAIGNTSYAQLFVKNGSYLFNNDNVVFVKQDVNLETNSNFYLRNKAQLVQGSTGISTNSGEGKLSVFQEGTSNAFVYNYWCSPVGVASGAAGNTDFGILLLNRPTASATSTPITTTSYNGTTSSSSLVVAKYWIWKYLVSATYDPSGTGWIHVQDAQTIVTGQGFTMKGVTGTDVTNVGESTTNNAGNNQRYDFRGRPNDGDITVNVDASKFTLTGNPYPSAMNVSAFLLNASSSNCTGVAYYWEQNKTDSSHNLADYHGGYGTYAPVSAPYTGVYVPATFDTYNGNGTVNTTGSSSGLVIERKYAPVGQGFMIEGSAFGSVLINNSYREYVKEDSGLSQFERSAVSNTSNQVANTTTNQVPHLRFDISLNNQNTRQLALILIPEATDLVDKGIDAKSPAENTLPNDVYFTLDNGEYIIQGVPFDVNKRIKIGVKSGANVPFSFKLSHVINFDQNQDVYIYDGLTQTYHDIKNGVYNVVLPGGTINNRFEITFTASALNTVVNIEENFGVYQNNDFQSLTIQNPKMLDVRSISLFDITGKVIFAKEKLQTENEYKFPTSNLSDGVYIVNLVTTDNQKLSHKIIIKNSKR